MKENQLTYSLPVVKFKIFSSYNLRKALLDTCEVTKEEFVNIEKILSEKHECLILPDPIVNQNIEGVFFPDRQLYVYNQKISSYRNPRFSTMFEDCLDHSFEEPLFRNLETRGSIHWNLENWIKDLSDAENFKPEQITAIKRLAGASRIEASLRGISVLKDQDYAFGMHDEINKYPFPAGNILFYLMQLASVGGYPVSLPFSRLPNRVHDSLKEGNFKYGLSLDAPYQDDVEYNGDQNYDDVNPLYKGPNGEVWMSGGAQRSHVFENDLIKSEILVTEIAPLESTSLCLREVDCISVLGEEKIETKKKSGKAA